jgi:hypothetical protein
MIPKDIQNQQQMLRKTFNIKISALWLLWL